MPVFHGPPPIPKIHPLTLFEVSGTVNLIFCNLLCMGTVLQRVNRELWQRADDKYDGPAAAPYQLDQSAESS
eukprot:g34556.t1